MKHRLKSLLKDRSGSTVIIIPFLVLGVLILGTTMWEYSRLNTVAQGSRDAVQTAITQICTEQYDQLYNETGAMASTWNGKDNMAFIDQIAGFKDDFEKMHTLMMNYADFLKKSAKAYRETQQAIMDQARKLVN